VGTLVNPPIEGCLVDPYPGGIPHTSFARRLVFRVQLKINPRACEVPCKSSCGFWVTLLRPSWHLACLAFSGYSLDYPNHKGTRPFLLNSIVLIFLSYRIRLYLVFIHNGSSPPFLKVFSVHRLCTRVLSCIQIVYTRYTHSM